MKVPILLALGLVLLFSSACQAKDVCSDGTVTYVTDPSFFPALASPAATPAPSLMQIAGKMVAVDRVISGPVCNDVWSKTIYVACDIQIVQWKDQNTPNFFENCDLTIEPETTVYVAAHNDTAYYNGCSCHTGGEGE